MAVLAVAAVGFSTTTALAAPAAADVRINEVESSDGSPGDWVELVNTGTTAVDVSGWVVKDNDNSHVFTVPNSTTVAAGGHLALDVDPVFGLGSSDSARLFRPGGGTLADSYSWTKHATTTYGRCADGVGSFTTTTAATKGAANACPGGTNPGTAWPGGSTVANADATNAFGGNLSGLAFESAGVLWAVKNGPGTLYRLVPNGTAWRPDTTDGWGSGKALRFANGGGDPDAEGVVVTPDGLFVATERDNNGSASAPKVLRYNTSGTAATLNAAAEWNLTADLPAVAANSGLEGITWVPDAVLTAGGFRDERTNAAYTPSTYPGHGSGLYFVGLEANGTIYAYALDQAGTSYTRVATIPSGFPAVMELEFEPGTGRLWAVCDDTCQGRTATLEINTQGKLAITHTYDRPTGMSNYNNEGFAIAPHSTCAAGRKPVLWADDGNTSSHALRAGTLNCTTAK